MDIHIHTQVADSRKHCQAQASNMDCNEAAAAAHKQEAEDISHPTGAVDSRKLEAEDISHPKVEGSSLHNKPDKGHMCRSPAAVVVHQGVDHTLRFLCDENRAGCRRFFSYLLLFFPSP